jgi:F0F1-type ATP synthase membrane subunit b/b'
VIRKTLLASTLLLALLVPVVALASGGGDGAFNGSRFFRHVLNLAIFAGFIVYVAKTPLADFLTFRRNEIKESLDVAWDAKASAEDRFTDLQARLDGFDAEAAGMLSRVQEDGARERDRMVASGHDQARQVETATTRAISEEARRAADELREEAIDLAMGKAMVLLTGTVGDDDQKRLAKGYMTTLREAAQP